VQSKLIKAILKKLYTTLHYTNCQSKVKSLTFFCGQVAMCWTKLLAQCTCGSCGVLCCARKRTAYGHNNMPFKDSLGPATEAVSAICDLQPLTEYTLQFRRTELRSVVGIMGISGDSGSTPTPSATTADQCQQQQQQQQQQQNYGNGNGDVQVDNDGVKRSIGDGPTTRQKILVSIRQFSFYDDSSKKIDLFKC